MKSPNASPNVETTADAIFRMGVEVPVTAALGSRAKIQNVFTPVPSLAKPEDLNAANFVAKFAEPALKMNGVKTADASALLFAVQEVAGKRMAAGAFVSVKIVETEHLILANCATEIVPKTAMMIMPAPSTVSPVILKIVMLNAVTQQ